MNQAMKDRLNQSMPVADVGADGAGGPGLGDRLAATVYIQKVVVAADASGGQAFTPEVSGELIDAFAVCTVANASGTMTLRRGTTAITSAIVCAVQDVLSRTTTLVQAQKNLVKGETLNMKANGASDKGLVYLVIIPS